MDKYDFAIESILDNLKEHPNYIYDCWASPDEYDEGILFGFTGPDPFDAIHADKAYGCLTQIRAGIPNCKALTENLLNEILSDERIPTEGRDIVVDDLHVFAEWQRRLDKEREKLIMTQQSGVTP